MNYEYGELVEFCGIYSQRTQVQDRLRWKGIVEKAKTVPEL